MSRECCGPEEEPLFIGRKPATTDDLVQDGTGTVGAAPSQEHPDAEGIEESAAWWRDSGLLIPIAAGALLAIGYVLEWSGAEPFGTVVLAASLIAGASTFVPGALRGLVRGRLGVGLLMTIAAIGAVALGRVGEAAALAFLFSIAEALEDRAMDRARDGLRALLALLPEKATVSRLSGEVVIPARDLQILDLVIVRPGERIPTDGIVTTGRSSIDASAITGESIPVEVGPGSIVPAGSINGGGALQVEATAGGRDNSLTTIVELVEQAQARKGVRARLADRIAKPLVPLVLIIAGLIVIFGFLVGDPATWTERALVVLVAASPCALAIAVPVTVISAIGAASRFGVVIKSGEAFEQLGAVRTIAFDKTGTLTRNSPQVVSIDADPAVGPERVLNAAAALERQSTHPLAAALVARANGGSTALDVVEHAGEGVSGVVDGATVRLGSPRWVPAGSFAGVVEQRETEGITVVVVEIAGAVAGVIGIRDELKPEAPEVITTLAAQGIRSVMLTGDNVRTARSLAREAGIVEFEAERLPAQKASAVESLSTAGTTAMVGDGINDAPALSAADVGIAMGATGSAVAIESADVAFTGTDLRLLPQALAHARRGRRIMMMNIILALAIIVVLFPLALFGVLGLAGVVLVHEIAEVVVILNGVRAARGRAVLPSGDIASRAVQEHKAGSTVA